MLSVLKFIFFPAPVVPKPNNPTEAQKTEWSNGLLKNFHDSLSDDSALKKIVVDGLFVEKQGRLITADDFLNTTVDEVLQQAISKTNQFKFRDCNVVRIVGYFNQLNLLPEIKNEMSELKKYKVSLAIYQAFVSSPYGRAYDELIIDANMNDAQDLLRDKREFEQSFLNSVKMDLSITNDGFVLV